MSAAVLGSGKSAQVFAKNGKDAEVMIAMVGENREMAKLDLYINCTQAVTLSARGGEVHLSGYFEPKGDDMDDDMFYGQEDDQEGEDLEDEDSDEEETPAGKKNIAASLNQAKANSQKNAGRIMQADSDEESDLEEDDMEALDSEDEINMGSEDESSEEVPAVHKKAAAKQVVEDSDEEDADDMLIGEDLSDDSEEVDLQAIMAKAQAHKAKQAAAP